MRSRAGAGREDVGTFLLLPGAGGRAWYWHRPVPGLERRGHRVAPAREQGRPAELAGVLDALVTNGTTRLQG